MGHINDPCRLRRVKTLVFTDSDGKLRRLNVDPQMPTERCAELITANGYAASEFVIVWSNNLGTESRCYRRRSEWVES